MLFYLLPIYTYGYFPTSKTELSSCDTKPKVFTIGSFGSFTENVC